MADKITASEALFGFIGWLTSRKEGITMSATHDAAEACELVSSFCIENALDNPRDNYTDLYSLPKEQDRECECGATCEKCSLNLTPNNMFNFGKAIELLKQGKRVARNGWNGKGMFLQYVEGHGCDKFAEKVKLGHLRNGMLPWIGMKTADEGFVPCLASQTDMLAEDWTEIAHIESENGGEIKEV